MRQSRKYYPSVYNGSRDSENNLFSSQFKSSNASTEPYIVTYIKVGELVLNF